MSVLTYHSFVQDGKPLVWLRGEIKTPPFSRTARIAAGVLLRRLQTGEPLSMPESRPMPKVGARCYELRLRDEVHEWQIIYRLDSDAVVILDVFSKKSRATPDRVIQSCRERLRRYEAARA